MKVGPDGTHRGWLRFQFSYCNENCIAINCCSRNYLPTVPCDSITQWVMWWTDSARDGCWSIYSLSPSTYPGDSANEQRCFVQLKRRCQYMISWWLQKYFLLLPFVCGFSLPDLNLWFSARVPQGARFGSIIINNTQCYFPRTCYVPGSELSASYTLSLIVSITLYARGRPPVSALSFFLNNKTPCCFS